MMEEHVKGEELAPAAEPALVEVEPGDGAAEPEAEAGSGAQGAPLPAVLQIPPAELKPALEAVLFSFSEPIAVRSLAELFGVSVHDVRQAAEELRLEYVESGRAFRLEDIAGGIQILTLPAHDPWIRRLRQKQRDGRLSAAAFETLAVIAYKQPITKADLEAIRGVQCSPILKTLLDRGLVKVVGRDESLGKPLLYGTTRRFLESFGLPHLRDLPQPESLPLGKAHGPEIN
jgi:segregation and condensation protein B